jgi:hypothetical protein
MNREDDTKWPQKNKDGRQELEIRLGSEHISFEVRTSLSSSPSILTLPDCQNRLTPGCSGLIRSRGSSRLLLPRPGSESSCLFVNLAPFQGKSCADLLPIFAYTLADQADISFSRGGAVSGFVLILRLEASQQRNSSDSRSMRSGVYH